MRGYIRKRGNAYEVTVSDNVNPVTGKRRRIFRTAQTHEGAEQELTKILHEIDRGSFADPGKLSLAEYLESRWLPHMASRVRPRTLLRYRQLLEGHVIPRIGGIRLARLRPLHIQSVLDEMLTAGRAPRTVAGAYRVLHGALAQGLRWQILSANVAAAVRPPRAERPQLQSPTSETVKRILEAAHGSRLYVPLILAATTGMRRGEVLRLRWDSVDLDARLLRVVTSLQHVNGQLAFADPKTDRARRTVALPAATVTVLRRQRREQAERHLLLGEAWTDLDLVIDQGDGQPLSPDSVSRAFYRLVRTLGLPGLRLHDLRHGYATALLVAGVHPKVVSEALGHTSVAFTLDTYSHVLPSMQEAAGAAIQAAFGEAIAAGED